jgi:CheY-like chemotaxis protein
LLGSAGAFFLPSNNTGSNMSRVSGTVEISLTRRVLIVDDHADSADLIALWLEQDGHETRTALDGVSGLTAAIEFEPDVAVLDLALPPPSDGYELAQAIRARPELSKCRLIAVSGYGDDADRARSAGAGFERHLTKPVNLQELRSAVRAQASERASEA